MGKLHALSFTYELMIQRWEIEFPGIRSNGREHRYRQVSLASQLKTQLTCRQMTLEDLF
jgi:hypothetical protein